MPRSALLSVLAVLGAAALVVAAALLVVRPWEASTPAMPSAAETGGPAPELVDGSTHVLADAGPEAPVVVEFLDYECPACGSFHPVVDDLMERYDGQVTFAVRHFPLPSHPDAVPAALAAEAAAQQGAFAPMHDLLFERQAEWSGSADAAAAFRGYASELGLDLADYDAAVADDATLERVALDANAGIALGVRSTPTFFVDGQQVELQRLEDLEAAIAAALAP